MDWYLKQLFPLKYSTTYKENGVVIYHTWWMWFGRCFNQKIELLR